MDMRCHACGHVARSMIAEAKHRHNFPALCNKNSRAWKRFQKELAEEKAAKQKDQPHD